MNSRAFIVLAVLDQAVVLGALLYLVGAWALSWRDHRRRKQQLPRLAPFHFEAKPSRPFLVWIDSLPRLGETPTAPLRPLRNDEFSAQGRD